MLYYAVIFFLVAAFLGFGGVAAGAAGISIFFVIVLLACVSLIAGVFRHG